MGYVAKNPCKKLRFGESEADKAQREKRPFSEEQLVTLFTSEAFRPDYPKSRTLFWTTVMALFHGFRMEEILQLTSDDIKEDAASGILFFDIHDEGDNRLKNRNARRRVPVHSTLIKLGFKALLASASSTQDKRLFPDVKRAKGIDTSYRKNFTRTYSRYLKRCGVHHSLTTFHSLRRNFTVAGTNAKIPSNIRAMLEGSGTTCRPPSRAPTS